MKHLEFSKDPSTKVKRKICRNAVTFHQLDFLLQPALCFLGMWYTHRQNVSVRETMLPNLLLYGRCNFILHVSSDNAGFKTSCPPSILTIYSCLHVAVHPLLHWVCESKGKEWKPPPSPWRRNTEWKKSSNNEVIIAPFTFTFSELFASLNSM